jgi:hypothetical protein
MKRLDSLRAVSRPIVVLVTVALLCLAAGGAYVALAATKGGGPKITSGPGKHTKQTSATFTYRSKAGVTFLCSLDSEPVTPCGNGPSDSTSYAGPLAPGSHTFRVEARIGPSTSDPATWTWTVDTTPPPRPILEQTPPNPTTKKQAKFAYSDSERGVSFWCKLDGAVYRSCRGSQTYRELGSGLHTFCVDASDQAGNFSAATCYTWLIGAGAAAFSIAGGPLPGSLLYPGAPAVAINLVFTNPNAAPIAIQSVTVAVGGTSAAGCAAGNFTVSQNLTATPTVPANSTRSLQELGVPQTAWPKLQMIGDQDACQNATVELTYSGTATG